MDKKIADDKTKLIAAKGNELIVDVHNLTEDQLKALGVSQLAYVKTIMINGEQAFAIHAADGTPVAVTDNAKTAYAAIVQYEMLPTMVH
ncbi:DUF1150 family protein [Commensalibacter oyaizuii]|uniref:DUF1150 family protein n=1 Tax=Commensalibacter oyaizuii TaxID=3043873 RepID=A0ABT6PZ11_9PROT|nr:DUF1150 family protein [Commensalibacter sp. TBRC 16381]MDI2090094.1 DUF1150 family protein [Commensalibacter sp. TBRC 16381]